MTSDKSPGVFGPVLMLSSAPVSGVATSLVVSASLYIESLLSREEASAAVFSCSKPNLE